MVPASPAPPPPDVNAIISDVLKSLVIYYTNKAGRTVGTLLGQLLSGRRTARNEKLLAALILYRTHAYGEAAPLLKEGMLGLKGAPLLWMKLFLVQCLYMSGQVKEGRKLAVRTAKSARSRGMQLCRLSALLGAAASSVQLRRLDEAEEFCKEAEAIAITERGRDAEAAVKQMRGIIARRSGDYEAARSLLAQSLQLAKAGRRTAREAAILDNLGSLHLELGELDDAIRKFKRSLKLERKLDNLAGQVDALANLGLAYLHRGDHDAGEQALTEALAIDEAIGSQMGQAIIKANLGDLYTVQGKHEQAAKYLTDAKRVFRRLNNREAEADVIRCLGRLSAVRGEWAKATRHLREAAEVHRKMRNRFGEARVRFELGMLNGQQGDLATAETSFRRSRELWRSIGNGKMAADCTCFLARLARQRGDTKAAADLYADASREYLSMGLDGEANALFPELFPILFELGLRGELDVPGAPKPKLSDEELASMRIMIVWPPGDPKAQDWLQ